MNGLNCFKLTIILAINSQTDRMDLLRNYQEMLIVGVMDFTGSTAGTDL